MSLISFLPLSDQEKFKKDHKVCKYCNKEKHLSEFPIRKDNYGGYDHRCYSCRKKRVAMVEYIKQTAPPKPKCCEKCGREPTIEDSEKMGWRHQGLCLDHDPDTNEFRGYLCHLCNRSLGGLGDTIEGVQEMLDYLLMAKKRSEDLKNETRNTIGPSS